MVEESIKHMMKKMLNEFVWYIAHKEQLISIINCLSFARLVIRGCAQPLYKKFHHIKMVNEIKNYYERKNELLTIFEYANHKVFITFDI
jgi:hypothetical protein